MPRPSTTTTGGGTLLLAALVLFLVFGSQPSGQEQPGKHRAPPKGMGNVQLTIWAEHPDNAAATVRWSAGKGEVMKVSRRSVEHWDDVAAPGQSVTATVVQFHLGESGKLKVYVVQNNNGRILCQNENIKNRTLGASCTGVVTI